jgi:hypothetical protein
MKSIRALHNVCVSVFPERHHEQEYPIVTMETDAEASGIENHGCLDV